MALKYIGTIGSHYGFRGEFIVYHTPADLSDIAKGTQVSVGFSEQFARAYTVKSWENKRGRTICSFAEVKSDIAAKQLREQGIFIEEELLRFGDEESYFVGDLIGCKVIDVDTKAEIGTLKDVLLLPANDVFVVTTSEGELPVPFIADVVKKVDIKKKIVEIFMLDGLADLVKRKE
jgi:16S rRNA processing protein RimM